MRSALGHLSSTVSSKLSKDMIVEVALAHKIWVYGPSLICGTNMELEDNFFSVNTSQSALMLEENSSNFVGNMKRTILRKMALQDQGHKR